jgi:hypothetical protein
MPEKDVFCGSRGLKFPATSAERKGWSIVQTRGTKPRVDFYIKGI